MSEWETFGGRFAYAFGKKNERLLRDGKPEISRAELARRVGTGRANITHWMQGATSRPEARFVNVAARELDVDPHWLANGDGVPFLPPGATPTLLDEDEPGLRNLRRAREFQSRKVPVISWVQAGNWQEAIDPFAPGDGFRFEDVATPVGPNAFALEVRGGSMEPLFPEGCIIIVDPSRRAKPGDYVVARATDRDEATFKKYVKDGPVHRLIPINPQYQESLVSTDAVICGVVVEKIIREKF